MDVILDIEELLKRKPRRSKVSPEDRKVIMNLFDNDVPILHIAEKFKLSRPTIYSIISSELCSEIPLDRDSKISELIHKKHLKSINHERKSKAALKTVLELKKIVQGEEEVTPKEEVKEVEAKEEVKEVEAKEEVKVEEEEEEEEEVEEVEITPQHIINAAAGWNTLVKDKDEVEDDVEKRNVFFDDESRKLSGLCLHHNSDDGLTVCTKKGYARYKLKCKKHYNK
jgi:glutamyl/glutaminyl-tRNA synthetase